MKHYWRNIYSILRKYREKYDPKKEKIKNKYIELNKKLKEDEEKELKLLSDKINKEVNPNNEDIFVSGQTLHYELGAEIGSFIKIKLKKDLKEKPKDLKKYLEIKDHFIFKYTMVDRDGIFMFVSDDWDGWLDATFVIAYFDVEVIHSSN